MTNSEYLEYFHASSKCRTKLVVESEIAELTIYDIESGEKLEKLSVSRTYLCEPFIAFGFDGNSEIFTLFRDQEKITKIEKYSRLRKERTKGNLSLFLDYTKIFLSFRVGQCIKRE